jgi:hypothetical protein
MKRHVANLTRLLFVVSGGAIINVAVALGCLQWSRFDSSLGRALAADDADSLWDRFAPQVWTSGHPRPEAAGQWSGFGLSRIRIGDGLISLPENQVLFGLNSEGDELKQLSILDCGWPARSLRRIEADSLPNAVARMRSDYQLDRNTDASWKDFRPLVLATAINAVLYAFLLWSMVRIAVVLCPIALSLCTTSRLVRLAVVLPVAAIVNIAMAWACAAYSGTRNVTQPAPPMAITTDDLLRIGPHADIVDKQRSFGVERSTTVQSVFMGATEFDGIYSERIASVEACAGWPCRSLRGSLGGTSNGNGAASLANNRVVLRWRMTLDQYESPALLPMAVLPAGFALNTIFYTAVLWPFSAIPGIVRRRLRAHRGRCVACGYELRGLRGGEAGAPQTCPECGLQFRLSASPRRD